MRIKLKRISYVAHHYDPVPTGHSSRKIQRSGLSLRRFVSSFNQKYAELISLSKASAGSIMLIRLPINHYCSERDLSGGHTRKFSDKKAGTRNRHSTLTGLFWFWLLMMKRCAPEFSVRTLAFHGAAIETPWHQKHYGLKPKIRLLVSDTQTKWIFFDSEIKLCNESDWNFNYRIDGFYAHKTECALLSSGTKVIQNNWNQDELVALALVWRTIGITMKKNSLLIKFLGTRINSLKFIRLFQDRRKQWKFQWTTLISFISVDLTNGVLK